MAGYTPHTAEAAFESVTQWGDFATIELPDPDDADNYVVAHAVYTFLQAAGDLANKLVEVSAELERMKEKYTTLYTAANLAFVHALNVPGAEKIEKILDKVLD